MSKYSFADKLSPSKVILLLVTIGKNFKRKDPIQSKIMIKLQIEPIDRYRK